MAVLFAPALLMWAFDEKIWLGIAAAFIWGCAMFWALQMLSAGSWYRGYGSVVLPVSG
ncbi:hypothetical protein ACL1A8_01110 [Corynebacterium striatum]